MSDRNTILEEISCQKNLGQDIVRRKYISQLANYTHNDTVVYISSFGKPGIPSNAIQISALFFIVAFEITFEFVTSQLFFILISSGESYIETVSNQKSQKILIN